MDEVVRLLLNSARLILIVLVLTRLKLPVFAGYLALFFVWFLQQPVNAPEQWLSEEYVLLTARIAVAGEALWIAKRGMARKAQVVFLTADFFLALGGAISIWEVTELRLGIFLPIRAYILTGLLFALTYGMVFAPKGRIHLGLLAFVILPQVAGALLQPWIQLHPDEGLWWTVSTLGNLMGFLAMLAWISIIIQKPQALVGR